MRFQYCNENSLHKHNDQNNPDLINLSTFNSFFVLSMKINTYTM